MADRTALNYEFSSSSKGDFMFTHRHWLFALLATASLICAADEPGYHQPPRPVKDALNSLPTPLASVSPQNNYVIFLQPVRYPSISEVAQPIARLAGLRIDIKTNGMHMSPNYISYTLVRLSDNSEVKLDLPSKPPSNPKLSAPIWSPDGQQFAFTNTTSNGIELYIASAANGKIQLIKNVQVNGVLQIPVQWLGDNRTLIVRTVPAKRGTPPVEAAIPQGPDTQESLGHAGPTPTYEDLLTSPYDEDLFDYYATSQLAYIDASSGRINPFGEPAIYTRVEPSPDNKHLLVERIHRPFSYQLTAYEFPEDVEVWSRGAKLEYKLASLPMADHVPLAGVRTGPRAIEWLPEKSAMLTWAEALDGGNPKETVPHRDRILVDAAPFKAEPHEVFETKERFRGLTPLAGGKALVVDYQRTKRILTTQAIDLDNPSAPPRVIFSRNERDAYGDPGQPVIKTMTDGRTVVLQSGDDIFLTGLGASPAGDKPFLDKFNVATGKSQRLFQSSDEFESVIAVLDDSGSRLLTRRESPTDPPNYFIRSGSQLTQITHFSNPMPQAEGVKKELVTYKRADGVPLSFTLYLPPSYQPGTRLPTIVWAYPYEFSDASTAGQVTGHSAQAFPELNYHQLVVLHGYALLDNAAMPIVGDPDTVNNTYVEQLQMDAQAAIDKAVDMGIADRDRIGVFGHSYGAFMTANLLAHTTLFHAGVAESGAYNRTLTPFGFQSERRTFWEAPDVYAKMSPFWYADKIKTPLLLIHGKADDNTGTFPIQSERLYAAVRGNGGTVRLVMLPAEAHGYRAKETMEDVLYEELAWFDRYLRPNDH
jgi:dipeptidyl aminopeptidase/acylaminoacyl peptidase